MNLEGALTCDAETMPDMAWLTEPARETVLEREVSIGSRTLRAHIRGRTLLELTEHVDGDEQERVVPRTDQAWTIVQLEAQAGAFEDGAE